MAAPNIVGVTTIKGQTVGAALASSSNDILVNSVGSGKVLKVNAIYVSNITGSTNYDSTVGWYDASTSTTYYLGYAVTVPSKSTLEILGKSIYLEEGDKINGLASANSALHIVVSYEEIS